MGHIRLGRIPKTRTWASLFDALGSETASPRNVAASVVSATTGALERGKGDAALTYCFWLLARIATAARSDDFASELEGLGLRLQDGSSALALVQQAAHAAGQELRRRGNASIFATMAELTLREVLASNVVEQSRTLFGTTLEDVQSACRGMSTTKRFGRVAREFFGIYMSRVVEYVADKEMANYVGPSATFRSSAEVLRFQESLKQYCLQAAGIIDDFAGGWFSKHNWESNNAIPETAAMGFTAYALEKLQMELGDAVA